MDERRLNWRPCSLSGRLTRRDTIRRIVGAGAAGAALVRGQSPPAVLAQDSATPEPIPEASPVASGQVSLEWLGWSHFRLTSVTGKVILLNPWVEGNPDAAVTMDEITAADLVLASQGHPDDIGNAVALAIKTGAMVFEPFELGSWMIEQGVPEDQVRRSGQGGRFRLDGITVRMVNAIHGSSVDDPNRPTVGLSAGYVITFENGWTLYFDGNSAATQDMALWAELYQPQAMIFNLNPNREPLDAALAIELTATNNPNLNTLIPHHHRVEPPQGATSVVEVQAALDARGVAIPILDIERGRVYGFP